MAAGNSTLHPPRPSAAAFALRVALALLATCCALWLAAWLTQGSASAWPRFEDDAYYYLEIARNVASGHGFTADTLSPTNGFQPLWLWSLVPVAWLTSGDTTLLHGATQVAVVLIFCLSGGLLCALLRARVGLLPALLGTGVLLFPRFSNVLLSGMEAGVSVLVLAALTHELLRGPALASAEPARGDLRAGALFGLLFLARLDSVFIAAACAGAVALSGLTRRDTPLPARIARMVRKGLSVFWPMVALAAPYLVWNVVRFGHLVPISGALKTSHSQLGFMPENVNGAYAVLLALALAAAALELRRPGDRALGRVLAALAAGLSLQLLHAVVFMRWAVFSWHFALFIPVGALAVGALARAVQERWPRAPLRAAVALAALALVAAQAVAISRLPLTFTGAGREAGRWVAKSLPPDAVLGMKDSGAFSFFSERRVMNLDGVVNSFEFQEALCRGELAEFLARHGVAYIVQHAVPTDVRAGSYESYVQPYPCHFTGPGSELTLRRDDEVFRGSPYRSYFGDPEQLVIWRIRP
jgi:hypothetical protein